MLRSSAWFRILFFSFLLLSWTARLSAQDGAPLTPDAQVENSGQPQPEDKFASAARTQTKKYKVNGTVENAATGEALARALVTVNNQVTTMTDSNGNFEFDGIAAGSYYFQARKPGYFSPEEITQGASPPGVFEVGPEAKAVALKLSPEAIVFGRITDSDGLPVPRLGVRCSRLAVVDGRKQWQQSETAMTDEDGEYRLAKLTPGTFRIKAGPSRMAALGAMARTGQQNSGYSAAFFPGAKDGDDGQGVRLNTGQKLEVNLTVDAAPFYKINGTLSGANSAWMRLTARGEDQDEEGNAALDGNTGTFTFRMVPAGDYTLRAQAQQDHKQLYVAIPLHVAGDIAGLPVVLQPMLTIPIETRVERTKPQNAGSGAESVTHSMVNGLEVPQVHAQVRFRPVGDHGQEAVGSFEEPIARPAKDGQVEAQSQPVRLKNYAIRNVVPGAYAVEIQPTSADLYVASARYGSTDLLRENLTVTASANQGAIEMVMRDDGGKIKGTITSDGGNVKQAMVLVVPEHGSPSVQALAMLGEHAEFTVPVLRPGAYSLLAFDDVTDLAYSDASALEPYMSHATSVELAPNQETSITLELIERGEK